MRIEDMITPEVLMKLTKDTVVKKLKEIGPQREFRVVFLKVNGKLREMNAMMEVPPADGGEVKDISELEAIPVMELKRDSATASGLEKGQWRSFRLDSVVELL